MIFTGPLWDGSTSLQRLNAFLALDFLEVHAIDSGLRVRVTRHTMRTVLYSLAWKAGWAPDIGHERARLLSLAREITSDVIFVDSSRVLTRSDLSSLRRLGSPLLCYYVPDNVVARHNTSRQLTSTFPDWDVFFTTKSFNVAELAAMGVRKPVLIGKAYDAALHRPLPPEVVGADFERFDVVFMGAYERERLTSINRLAQAGFSVAVFSSGWPSHQTDSRVSLRMIALGEDYIRGMHVGKIALCFLRKINRDRITQRSMEIPAMQRPMVAERTDEHDAHFCHGTEYLGFRNDDELIHNVRLLLNDDQARRRLALRGRERCLTSGYSTIDRARQMIGLIADVRRGRDDD